MTLIYNRLSPLAAFSDDFSIVADYRNNTSSRCGKFSLDASFSIMASPAVCPGLGQVFFKIKCTMQSC